MLKLCLRPQPDKLHAFPAPQLFALLGSQRCFFESQECKVKENFESNLFFSARFATLPSERGTSAWSTENRLHLFMEEVFFSLHRAGIIDYVQREERSQVATEELLNISDDFY